MARIVTISGSKEKLLWLMQQPHFSEITKKDWQEFLGITRQRMYFILKSETANLTHENCEGINQGLNKFIAKTFKDIGFEFTLAWWKKKNNWKLILPELNINYYSEYQFDFKVPIKFRFNKLLDDIKVKYKIKNDEDIAALAKINKASLSNMRSAKVSGLLLLKVIKTLEENYEANWQYVFGLSDVMYRGSIDGKKVVKKK